MLPTKTPSFGPNFHKIHPTLLTYPTRVQYRIEKKKGGKGNELYRGLRIRVTQVTNLPSSQMTTVVATISDYELDYRCEDAIAALANGKKVSLAPGFFRASGISPKELMEKLLSYLYMYELEVAQAEMFMEAYDRGEDAIEIRQWRVFITRKPEDLSFVIEAKCID